MIPIPPPHCMARSIYCTCCGRGDREYKVLVAAPGGFFMCNFCVEIARVAVAHHIEQQWLKLKGFAP